MMSIKLYANLLIIITAFQGLQLQSTGEQCTAEEVSVIKEDNSNVIAEKLENSNSSIQKRLSDVKDQLAESLTSSPASNVLNDLEQAILNLEPSECSKKLQAKLDTKKLKINASQSKCSTQSTKKVLGTESKINSTLKKLQSTKNSTDVALEKCSLKNSLSGCSAVESCIELVIIQLKYKIDISTIKLGINIGKVVSEQNNCLRKIIKEALELQEDIEGDIIECTPKATDSDASGESHKSKESSESSESKSEEKLHTSTEPHEKNTVNTKPDEQVTISTKRGEQVTTTELPKQTEPEPAQTKTITQAICVTNSEREDTTVLTSCTPAPTTDPNDLDVLTETANTETEPGEVPKAQTPGNDENDSNVNATKPEVESVNTR